MQQLLLASLVFVSSALVSAQSVPDGAWIFTMTSPMGSVDAKVVMKTEGGTLTGDAVAGQAMAMGATVDWSMARAK